MSRFQTLDDLPQSLGGKVVLARVDLNVPMRGGAVTDLTRIARLAPTLSDLRSRGARVALISHFGRPGGVPVPEMSLRPLGAVLDETFGATLGIRSITFAGDCVGDAAASVVGALSDGDVCLLENLRFHAGEETNDIDFARQLAEHGDYYINDAFSCAHRAHASTEAIAHILPCFAGRLMQVELQALESAWKNAKKPVAAIVGGAKISSKLAILKTLAERVDKLIIGGGMANTFLFAKGVDVGASLCERNMADTARDIAVAAEHAGCTLLLPSDAVVAKTCKAGAFSRNIPLGDVGSDEMILDIGPDTIGHLMSELSGCRTLLWNGPLGAFEVAPFDAGTNAVATEVARLSDAGSMVSVAGGGDTVAALAGAGAIETFSYISTAGGAFLEWLEGKTLPGVAALERTNCAT